MSDTADRADARYWQARRAAAALMRAWADEDAKPSADALARKHGACPRCPQPSWHGPSGCPLCGSAKERPYAVPCARCRRPTFRNDALCPACAEHSL